MRYLAVPSYGAMALKPPRQLYRLPPSKLAVPSYGAMALKHFLVGWSRSEANLAVPSYGAMALKHQDENGEQHERCTCSPLLRGDGPETCH